LGTYHVTELDRPGEPDRAETPTDTPAVGMPGARFGSRLSRLRRADGQSVEESPPPSWPERDDGSHRRRGQAPEVGLAGARFGSSFPRRHRPEHAADDPAAGADPVSMAVADVGPGEARFGRLGSRRRSADPALEWPKPPADHGPAPAGSAAAWPSGPEAASPAPRWLASERGLFAEPARGQPRAEPASTWPPPDRAAFAEPQGEWREVDDMDNDGGYDNRRDVPAADSTTLVRPYIRTGGRTRGPANLGIETLVSVTPGRPPAGPWSSEPDYRMVVELCAAPRSVAEIAALASLPLGVARVLLADMARIGVIRIHKNTTASNGAPDLALMQRVLAGLRRL
jgi:Protein of unknown function (DUF742)